MKDLDGALDELDRICEISRSEGSMMGVFPAMYRQVTRAIHRAVREGGCFDDDTRLEHLATDFARRYVTAYDAHRAGEPVSRAWAIAFDVATAARPRMIVQHLLLGMNAHINYDLGMSAATVGRDDILAMEDDFVRVDDVLFALVDGLQDGLGEVSPRMSALDRFGGSWDERIMRMGIRRSRALAWPFAVRVATAEPRAREDIVRERDEDAELIGKIIVRRWSPITLFGRFVASAETGDVGRIIDALETIDVDPFQVTGSSDPRLEAEYRRLGTEIPGRMRVGARLRRT